jgi:hypothetical protein
MIRRLFRFALKLAVVGSAVAVAVKALARRRSASSTSDWSTSTEPWPPLDLSDKQTAGTGPASSEPAVDAELVEVDVELVEVDVELVETAAPDAGAEAVAADPHEAWSDPDDDGSCPTSHPIKAKLTSKVFHLPGMANYDRTKADRCYLDAGAAEADGLRQAKR